MRKFLFLCILITLTGCDRWFDAAYTLGSVSTYEGDGEIRALCKHLSGLAAAHDLVKREAVRDSTLCVYSDSEHMFLVLGARSLNGQLVVDVQVLTSTRTSRALNKDLLELLAKHYPGQFLKAEE